MKQSYVQAVLDMIHAGKSPEEVLDGLQQVLSAKGHQRLYPSILAGVLRVLQAETDRYVPQVTVARNTDLVEHKEAIMAALRALGTDDEPVVAHDDTLAGGFVASYQNRVYDASYKTKLAELYRKVTS